MVGKFLIWSVRFEFEIYRSSLVHENYQFYVGIPTIGFKIYRISLNVGKLCSLWSVNF